MVKVCAAVGCPNRGGKGGAFSFFRFPQNKRKRRAWTRALNRKNWKPNEHSYLCSAHFVDGWHSDFPEDENYSPTKFSYKEREPSEDVIKRRERQEHREIKKMSEEAEVVKRQRLEGCLEASVTLFHDYTQKVTEEAESGMMNEVKESETQCECDPVIEENRRLKALLMEKDKEIERQRLGVHTIRDNNGRTKFYTGLPTFAVFLWLFDYLASKSQMMRFWTGGASGAEDRKRMGRGLLEPVDQLFATLVRLRLGLFVQDISDRFQISTSTFSKYFTTWICLLFHELKPLNPFPSRFLVDRFMPLSFKRKYPSTRVILDCTEIFIQRPSSLLNQNLTFSNYKHHNTLKCLVGITPSGVISSVSEAWGGGVRVSDRQITCESGILNLLDEGDSVMADEGFTIRDLLEERKCFLNIPPFRSQSAQFTTAEVIQTQEIAGLRIHVERATGRVKNSHIFDGVLPLSLAPLASKLFQVACWLTNLDIPLVQ